MKDKIKELILKHTTEEGYLIGDDGESHESDWRRLDPEDVDVLVNEIMKLKTKNMDIKEIKIVLDWAHSQVENCRGSKISNPERYEKAVDFVNQVKNLFDQECIKWIENNCK